MITPGHPCEYHGCSAIVKGRRFCKTHQPRSLTANAKGYDFRWARYSRNFLHAHPFCCDPFARHRGMLVPATVTGHKQPHRGDQNLFWSEENHYALCWSCNSYQAAKFEGGFGHERKELPLERSTTINLTRLGKPK
jgi:5-methylcytosine-specific restriction protein A